MHAARSVGFLLMMLFCSSAPGLAAQPAPGDIARSRIDAMLRTGHADASWFSATFLSQITVSEVDAGIAGLAPSLGAYESVEATANPNRYLAHFAKGTDEVLIYLDGAGKIAGLLFRPPVLASASMDDALGMLAAGSGTISYVVIVGGRTQRYALNATMPLAVGSTFKLAVLNGLLDQIRSGKRHWSDVVALQERWKSLGSGVLQKWPAGTPITLSTYATQMISISDNTAADALAHIAGTAAISPYAGNNQPFLTTREMLILKSSEAGSLRGMYLTVDSASGRSSVLQQIDAMALPRPEQMVNEPNTAIEWHYNVIELCKLMERVADLPFMSVNPGVAEPTDFAHVAYKGGSEAGVLNLTTAVTTHRGTKLCFSATVNDTQPVDESSFEAQYASALRRLAEL